MAVQQDIITQGLHAAWNKTTMLQEGNLGAFWDDIVGALPPLVGEIAVPGDQQGTTTNPNIFFSKSKAKDIA